MVTTGLVVTGNDGPYGHASTDSSPTAGNLNERISSESRDFVYASPRTAFGMPADYEQYADDEAPETAAGRIVPVSPRFRQRSAASATITAPISMADGPAASYDDRPWPGPAQTFRNDGYAFQRPAANWRSRFADVPAPEADGAAHDGTPVSAPAYRRSDGRLTASPFETEPARHAARRPAVSEQMIQDVGFSSATLTETVQADAGPIARHTGLAAPPITAATAPESTDESGHVQYDPAASNTAGRQYGSAGATDIPEPDEK